MDNNETNVDPDTDIEPRPSSVVGCPETHVDCGNCQCVPSSTCSWCSDDHPHPPVNPPGSGTGNSSVPLCPKNFKDCGSCLCVPEAVCSSCGEHPVQPLPNPLPNVSMRPSEVPGCPETNKDCGQCSCVPESSCNWCPGAAAVATTPGTEPVTTSPVQVTTPEPMPSTTTSSYDGLTSPGIISRPSRVPYCPAAYRDCGTCFCVPESTCILCPGAWQNPTHGGHIVSRPSEVPYCPASFVDCGTCLCVPESSCGNCPGAWQEGPPGQVVSTSPRPTPEIVARPSVVPFCPAGFVDCGTCLCVARATCQWCPFAANPPARPALPAPTTGIVNSRPSTIIGCPAAYRDCGTCFCVPESSCQWCPGAITRPSLPAPSPTPSPTPSPPTTSPISSRPSTVIGCPASYKDCGNCKCVPENTCQYCGSSPSPPPSQPSNIRPSAVIGCPFVYKDCGTCLCVPEPTCQYCPGAYSRPSSPSPGSHIRPSTIIGCPLGYKDCGFCRCVPEPTCQYCPGRRLSNSTEDFEGVI